MLAGIGFLQHASSQLPFEKRGVDGKGGGGARVKAVREMPRPCVENVVQAQGKLLFSKSSLTNLGQ